MGNLSFVMSSSVVAALVLCEKASLSAKSLFRHVYLYMMSIVILGWAAHCVFDNLTIYSTVILESPFIK